MADDEYLREPPPGLPLASPRHDAVQSRPSNMPEPGDRNFRKPSPERKNASRIPEPTIVRDLMGWAAFIAGATIIRSNLHFPGIQGEVTQSFWAIIVGTGCFWLTRLVYGKLVPPKPVKKPDQMDLPPD